MTLKKDPITRNSLPISAANMISTKTWRCSSSKAVWTNHKRSASFMKIDDGSAAFRRCNHLALTKKFTNTPKRCINVFQNSIHGTLHGTNPPPCSFQPHPLLCPPSHFPFPFPPSPSPPLTTPLFDVTYLPCIVIHYYVFFYLKNRWHMYNALLYVSVDNGARSAETFTKTA